MKPIILKNTIDIHKISILDAERLGVDHYIWPIEYDNSKMCIHSSYLNVIRYNPEGCSSDKLIWCVCSNIS